MKNNKIKAVAESAAGAALCTLFIMIALYVPILSGIAAVVCGIPIMYIYYKHNLTYGTLAFVCAAIVAFVLGGNVISVGIIILMYAAPAAVISALNSKKCGFYVSLLAAAAVVLAGLVAELSMLNGSGDGIRQALGEYLNYFNTSFTDIILSGEKTAGAEISALVSEALEQAADMVMYYLPTIAICAAMAYTYLIATVGAFILKRLRVANVPYVKLNSFSAPRIVCHVTVLLFAVTLFSDGENIYSAALNNVLLVSQIILGLSGFAFLDLKFSKVLKQWYIRAIIYLGVWFSMVMLVPFIAEIMVLIGFFRGLRRNVPGSGSGGETNES